MSNRLTRRELLGAGLATTAGAVLGCGGARRSAPAASTASRVIKKKPPGVVRFAHVPDVHMDQKAPKSVQLVKRLARVIARDHRDLDFVLFGGDNFNNNVAPGKDARQFADIMSSLPCPYHAVRGNKESQHAAEPRGFSLEAFRQMFGAGVQWAGRDWKLASGGVTILGVDTTIDARGNGLFRPESLTFVKSELEANPGRQHVVLTHHPYQNFWGGTEAADLHKYVLGNGPRTLKALTAYDNLALTLSGHKHRSHVASVSKTTVIATVGFVVPLDLETPDVRQIRVVDVGPRGVSHQMVSIS